MEKSEKIKLKIECLKMAIQIKPVGYGASALSQPNSYSVDQLLKDANKIYEEVTK